jgi:hypothetical protein
MLVKVYRQPVDGQMHYSPPEIIGTQTVRCAGKLDPAHISTRFAKRRNFSMRTGLIGLGPTIKLDHFSGVDEIRIRVPDHQSIPSLYK